MSKQSAEGSTRVVLVGCGEVATAYHLPALGALQADGLVDVVACDVNAARAEAAAARFGFEAATDWEKATVGADAVVVTVPPGPNAAIATEAAARGLHVLCEKPPGRTVEQAGAMAEAATRRPDVVTMVGFNRRFAPLYTEAIRRSRELGAPTAFIGRFQRAGVGGVPSNTADDWITSDGAHVIDLAVTTMGWPRWVSVSHQAVGSGPDNVWTVQLKNEHSSAVLAFHFAAGRRLERFEWAGPGYDVELELPKRGVWADAGGQNETWTNEDDAGAPAPFRGYGFLAEHRAFLDAIGGGVRPACDFAYGSRFMRLVAAILAAEPGAVVDIDSASPSPAAADAAPLIARSRPDRHGRRKVVIHQQFGAQERFFSDEALASLRASVDVQTFSGRDDLFADAAIVLTGRGSKPLPEDFADNSKKLELLVVLGASVKNWHADALLARGVVVCNTADAVARSVAEHCLMAALAGLRHLTEVDRAMHTGEWPRPVATSTGTQARVRAAVRDAPLPSPVLDLLRRGDQSGRQLWSKLRRGHGPPVTGTGADLRGATVGLVGWSYTAQRFVELLAPFDCNILVCSEAASDDELAAAGVRRASMGEVFGSSTVVSLHKGATASTRGLIGAAQLSLLRPGSILVNSARADLVDEAALVERVRVGDVVAAIDVFETEPLPSDHPLRKIPNVVLTPHNASTTVQEERRMGDQAVSIVLDWLADRPVPAISRARLDRMS